jgi:excinuclease ABC subunit A
VEDLPESFKQIVLYGSGEEQSTFTIQQRKHLRNARPFEGVIPNLERRYKETESNRAREIIGEFMASRPCHACKGSRLRPESVR